MLLVLSYLSVKLSLLFDQTISHFLHPSTSQQTSEITPLIAHAYLPYVHRVTDRISKLLKQQNIKTTFTTQRKLSDCLPSAKDHIPLHPEGVYRIPCSCGLVYIGETKRSVSTRVSEHERCTRLMRTSGSALAEHKLDTGHQINFSDAKILARGSHFFGRKIREAVEIFKHPSILNRDEGYYLHNSWKSFIVEPKRSCTRAPTTNRHASQSSAHPS